MILSQEIRELGPRDYFDIVLKRKWIVFITVTIAVSAVGFYSFTSPKIYQAGTTLLIEKQIPQITERMEDVYTREIRDTEYYQTQYSLLVSRSLAERVMKKLNLGSEPEFISADDPINALISMIKVKPVRLSNIVMIAVTGKDPLKITNIANTWAREFIHQDVEKKVGVAKYGVSWLEDQLSDTLVKLQNSEQELNQFIRKHRIVTIPDIETKKESLIESLKSQKSDLERQLKDFTERYKEKHPKMISLRAQLEAVDTKMADQTEELLSVQEVAVEYKLFKRKVDTYKSLYDDLLKRAKELDISKELTLTNIRVVDVAHAPKDPIKPSPKKDVAIAFLLSMFFSVSTAFFLEYMDFSLKTSEDVEMYTKLPFLGYIPSAKRAGKGGKPIELITQLELHSPIVEAFRNLRVSLLFSSPQDKPMKSLVVASSVPQEGKTFVAGNLAIISAQSKDATIIVDADMRKGNLSRAFNVEKERGLSSVLTGICSFEEAIIPAKAPTLKDKSGPESIETIPDLHILGRGPHTPNPTELLGSEKLRELFEYLKTKYARIIVDAPPILSVADALILGDMCDSLAMVIKASSTSLQAIIEAKKALEKKMKIIGGVLNNVDAAKGAYYYYHYYGYSQDANPEK